MNGKSLLLLSFILALSAGALAQTRTITNEDLEKYRQRRLEAERQYRENYERLGFPSPEELERRRIEDEKALIEYSQQLQYERLEREAIEAEREAELLRLQNFYPQTQNGNGASSGVYLPGYYGPYFYGGYYRNFPRRPHGRSNDDLKFKTGYPWMIIPEFRNLRVRPIRTPRSVSPGQSGTPPRVGPRRRRN